VLKFGAIDFSDRLGIAKKDFRGCFHQSGFAGACGAEKKQVAYRTARRVKAGAEYLVKVNQGLHSFVLPYDFGPQRCLKFHAVGAANSGIK
jgi:hypothetical protein